MQSSQTGNANRFFRQMVSTQVQLNIFFLYHALDKRTYTVYEVKENNNLVSELSLEIFHLKNGTTVTVAMAIVGDSQTSLKQLPENRNRQIPKRFPTESIDSVVLLVHAKPTLTLKNTLLSFVHI